MKILFYLPAILFLISGFPQMVKLIKTRKSDDVSLRTYLITCLAIGIIMIDAFLSGSWSIFTSNFASFIITGTNTILIIKYRK